MSKWDRYKPAVSRRVLLFLAAALWLCVGAMLLRLAVAWLSAIRVGMRAAFGLVGVALAVGIHRFGFLRIVRRNLERILPADDRRCLFGFMPWTSYVIVPVMIGLGATLRHSPIPKCYLAVLYLGIGLALVLSALRYVRALLREIRDTKPT